MTYDVAAHDYSVLQYLNQSSEIDLFFSRHFVKASISIIIQLCKNELESTMINNID